MQWIVVVSILQHCDANPRSYFDAATLFTGYNHIHPISEGRQGRSYKLVNGANSTLLGKKIDPSRFCHEVRIMIAAAQLGLAPCVRKIDMNNSLVITDFASGGTLENELACASRRTATDYSQHASQRCDELKTNLMRLDMGGILLGDIKSAHVVLSHGAVQFIDFTDATICRHSLLPGTNWYQFTHSRDQVLRANETCLQWGKRAPPAHSGCRSTHGSETHAKISCPRVRLPRTCEAGPPQGTCTPPPAIAELYYKSVSLPPVYMESRCVSVSPSGGAPKQSKEVWVCRLYHTLSPSIRRRVAPSRALPSVQW